MSFLSLPRRVRVRIYRELLTPRPHHNVDDYSTQSKYPLVPAFRIDPVVLAANRQISLEARVTLLEDMEFWTGDLFGGSTCDQYRTISSKIWTDTTIVLERWLQSRYILTLHVVIDTSLLFLEIDSPIPPYVNARLLGERILLKYGLQFIFKLLSRLPRPPKLVLSWLDRGIWRWEERRRWLFGELLLHMPPWCFYKLRDVPETHMVGNNIFHRFPRELFIQALKEDLGIEVQE